MFKISDTIFCGPRPIVSELKGILNVINLEQGWFEFFHGMMNQEFGQCLDAGILPLHIPFGDVLPPSFEQLDIAYNAVVKCKGNVYFHCLRGKDRTGMVRASVRVKHQNWKIEDAIKECLDLGGLTFPYSVLGWETRLRDYLKCSKRL